MALSSIEQNAQTLSSFGLTVKQAKVYLALVSLGTAPVGEISKLSKVRREEVYRILPKLEKMGLIEKTLTIPVKLKATSVDNALSILIRDEEEQAKRLVAEYKAHLYNSPYFGETALKKYYVEFSAVATKENGIVRYGFVVDNNITRESIMGASNGILEN